MEDFEKAITPWGWSNCLWACVPCSFINKWGFCIGERLGPKALPCFEVFKHKGNSPSDGHQKRRGGRGGQGPFLLEKPIIGINQQWSH
jgi:hypothetical protein